MQKHFFDMQVNTIDRNAVDKIQKSKSLFVNEKEIPKGDNIIIFEGVFSQKFDKGEKSRNGYKYMQDGWDVKNYATLPLILWQHDDSYGAIGFAQELFIDNNGNLSGIFFVDTEMLEDRHAKQVKAGYVTAISTGAITIEDGYEHNESGKLYTAEEAEDEFGWENIWKCLWGASDAILTYVVIQAELIENSLCTIGSNYKALAKQVNSMQDEMKVKAEELKTKQLNSQKGDTLIPNDDSMSKKENTSEDIAPAIEEEVKTDVVVEAEVQEEAQVSDVETGTEEGTQEVTEEVNEVEELKNKLTTLTDSFETYKNEMDAKFETLKVDNKVASREEDRAKVKKIFENSGAKQNASDVKSVEDFKKKHFG